MNRLIQFRQSIVARSLLVLLLACFAQRAQGESPAPAGGHAKGKSAEAANAVTKDHANVPLPVWNPCNTGTGNGALASNPTGWDNTADGCHALYNDTTGGSNTATGADALFNNNTGSQNTAAGFGALQSNNTGSSNTAVGWAALNTNTNGGSNTAIGFIALQGNTTGENNTAVGAGALMANTWGNYNTVVGCNTGLNGNGNTAVGFNALGNSLNTPPVYENVAVGDWAGIHATGSNNVYIGAGMSGVAGESNACYIASIFGQASPGGVPVVINSRSKLGTTSSSKRFKEDIKPMNRTSEALFSLRPVSFRYKKDIDPAGLQQFGLVAEDVEKINPDLVVPDKEGKPYSVRYDQVNAMLLNEFLKEHRKVEQMEKQIEALTVGLRKVNAQLKASKPAPQVVNNP